MSGLIVVGGGGFSHEVVWLAQTIGKWELLGVLDDDPAMKGKSIEGVPVLGGLECVEDYPSVHCVVAIGTPAVRRKVVEKLEFFGVAKFATLIHPTAVVAPSTTINEGSIVAANSVITTNVDVGKHCIINLACTIGHDVTLSSYVTLAPQVAISGCVNVGDEAELGTGARVRQGLSIGKCSMLAMGSVASKDVAEHVMVAGSPARAIKRS